MPPKRRPAEKRAAASAIDVDADARKRAAPAQTYYFLASLCRSYTVAQLWEIYDGMRIQLAGVAPTARGNVTFSDGTRVIAHKAEFTEDHDGLRDAGQRPPPFDTLIIDFARTNGQTECSLSLEPFERPMILANGFSYSEAALKQAVEGTIGKGVPLRLENFDVSPLAWSWIRVCANMSLPGWIPRVEVLRGPFVRPRAADFVYNEMLVQSRNVPAMSALFDQAPLPNDKSYLLDTFRRHHGYTNSWRALENLTIEHAVFPRARIDYFIVLRNILFRDCVIHAQYLSTVVVAGCRFERCIIILNESYTPVASPRIDFGLANTDITNSLIACRTSTEAMPTAGMLPQWVAKLLRRFSPRPARYVDCKLTTLNPSVFCDDFIAAQPYAALSRDLEQTAAINQARAFVFTSG